MHFNKYANKMINKKHGSEYDWRKQKNLLFRLYNHKALDDNQTNENKSAFYVNSAT